MNLRLPYLHFQAPQLHPFHPSKGQQIKEPCSSGNLGSHIDKHIVILENIAVLGQGMIMGGAKGWLEMLVRGMTQGGHGNESATYKFQADGSHKSKLSLSWEGPGC